MTTEKRGALFLDRDGTIIVDEHYLNDHARVKLLPGAARAVACANAANVPVVVITNQSGIGRGMISEDQYARVAARVNDLLNEHGARVDATYYCAELPGSAGLDSCRKPELFMYQRAAAELKLSLENSAYIGDKWRDVEPALRVGGFGILVPTHSTPTTDLERAVLCAHTAPDIEHAVTQALAWMRVPL